MKKKLLLLWLSFAAVYSGCASHSVISKTYDFGSVRRIGVMKVNTQNAPLKGVEDLFEQYLMKAGFTVAERANLDSVLNENKIGAEGLISPEMTKQLGKVLGVDLLLIGEVSSYTPEKETKTMVRTENIILEPRYSNVRKKGKGGSYIGIEQTGTKVRKEVTKTPIIYTDYPQVGLVAKLVDVETAEIVWVGSLTKQGNTAMEAAESVVEDLVKDLQKDMKRVSAKKGS